MNRRHFLRLSGAAVAVAMSGNAVAEIGKRKNGRDPSLFYPDTTRPVFLGGCRRMQERSQELFGKMGDC